MYRDLSLKLFKAIEIATKQSQDAEQAMKGLRKALVHFHGAIPRTTEIEKYHVAWTIKVQVNDAYLYSCDAHVGYNCPWTTIEDRSWKSLLKKEQFLPLAKLVTPIELCVKVGDAEYRYDIFDMKVLDEQ